MLSVETYKRAIHEESLSGWFFFNIFHRDRISDRLLDITPNQMNTRPWFYFLPAEGEPTAVCHSIEPSILKHLPGKKKFYVSRDELSLILSSIPKGRVAAQFSAEIPALSCLDHGTAVFLQSLGFELVSSQSLIQRSVGVLRQNEITLHEEAAVQLYGIVDIIWKKIERHFAEEAEIWEGDVQEWITSEFIARGLETQHPPIVASGCNSSNPHYSTEGRGKKLERGEVLQLDLFARRSVSEGIYADISWVGFMDFDVPDRIEEIFRILCKARDEAVNFIKERLKCGSEVSGREVDERVRSFLGSRGFSENIRHRTGHAIDREVHGLGVNLDSVEFPDNRKILEGSCFSVEPGLYFDNFGLRTEIDVFIKENTPVISGSCPQKKILVFSR
ncbi:MAG: peptidase M24 [Spirochaetes bacterium]|nr:MAG: peptidase M24 [Spirochaetota bacterium]